MTVFLSNQPYGQVLLASSVSQVHQHQLFQEIRAQINRVGSPFSGRVDWESIAQDGQGLATTVGVEPMLASYLCVANTKTQGVAGFALGLECFQFACFSCHDEAEFGIKRKAELLQWVVAQVTPDIRTSQVSHFHLRDLYRCERVINELIGQFEACQFSQDLPLDEIGYLVFEMLDSLEQGIQTQLVRLPAPLPKPTYYGPCLAAGLILGAGAAFLFI